MVPGQGPEEQAEGAGGRGERRGRETPPRGDYLFLWRSALRILSLLCFAIFLRRCFFTEPILVDSSMCN